MKSRDTERVNVLEEILSNELSEYAALKYKATLPLLRCREDEVSKYIAGLKGDEKVLMEFLYGTMPLCDAGDYEPNLMHSYVKHALFLRQEMEWTRELPEDIFLNYVLYYRVNNEDITDCRDWFYQKLRGIVAGLGQEEAVKEINYWCAAQAAYTSSDGRTLGPIGVYKSGSGRCGEESTFLVTALRSVGIASRQVYTPRWAHCDDNHAWVEARVDGKWRFLGACEPEEVLDKGWFTNASSRAMMIHTRVFSDYQSQDNSQTEAVTERSGAALFYNDTGVYARTGTLAVTVRDETGELVQGARVEFELLNGAQYYPAAVLYTDEQGKAEVTLGHGSIHVHVSKGGCCFERTVNAAETRLLEAVLDDNLWQEQQKNAEMDWQYTDITAPKDYPMHPVKLTREQKESGRTRKKEADRLREEKTAAGYDEKKAEEFQKENEILCLSYGNFEEIYQFLKTGDEPERAVMLSVLAPKDYRDITSSLLESHLTYAKQVKDICMEHYLAEEKDSEQIFAKYVINPRIRFENITDYRTFLDKYLSVEQKSSFFLTPEKIWDMIEAKVGCEESRNYDTVVATPMGAILCGQGSDTAKKTLFVAVCRTLGVPARLNPVNLDAEYYRNGAFVPVGVNKESTDKTARLILTSEESLVYFSSWSIGKLSLSDSGTGLKNGQSYANFQTLNYRNLSFHGNTCTLMLPEGIYRVITTTRLPNGNQMEAQRIICTRNFPVAEDGVPERILPLEVRRPEVSDMLEELHLEEFTLQDEHGTEHQFGSIMDCNTLLAFLEEGAEPTEHLLNELREHKEEIKASGLKLIFVVRKKEALENRTLGEILGIVPAQVYYDDFTELPEILARRMYTDPEKLPLVLLISPGMDGRYACSGYNVGSVELMLRISKMLKQ